MSGPSSSAAPTASSSTIKFLLSTDNHLGFAERDPRRGDDSFTTFEEILRAARVEHDVDAVLLGGDLFHDNKPSLGCLTRSCSLFRKYAFGDKPVELSLLSDPAKNFPTHALPLANFQDPNINVALPIFAIHGNHDDPVGGTSALDVLATNGCINYFGHVPSLDDIVVEPVLLRKGNTYVALFGIGNVRDERLHRCFRAKKVHFVHPKPVAGRKWFSILIVHQNRGVRSSGSKGGIMDHMLAGFGLDLVIWGNEHEQLMVPAPSHGFDIIQPGSSVLTSLSAQECNPKQYGILEILDSAYRLTPFPLRSVRPVVRRTIQLSRDHPSGRTLDAVEDFLRSVMEEMVEDAEEQVSRIPDDVLAFHPNIKFPLMRLAVDFTDANSAPFPQPNLNRFGQQYTDIVANPGELLRPIRPKPFSAVGSTVKSGAGARGGAEGLGIVPVVPQLNTLDIRAKVTEVFNHNAKDACTLLSEPEVSAAVYAFAEKGERDAIDERVMELLVGAQKAVWRKLGNGSADDILKMDAIVGEVVQHKQQVNEKYVRTLQADLAAHGGDGDDDAEAEDDDDGDGENSRQRRRESVVDVFERVAPLSSSEAQAALAGGGASSHTRAEDDALNRSVSSLVTEALRQARSFSSATAAETSAQRRVKAEELHRAVGYEDDELPGDGLDRRPVGEVVGSVMAGVEYSTMGNGARRPAAKRARADDTDDVDLTEVIDVDDGHDAPPPLPPRAQRGRGGGRTAGRRGRGGGGASALPARELVHGAAVTATAAAGGRTSPPPPASLAVFNGAMMQLLSKWGSQS